MDKKRLTGLMGYADCALVESGIRKKDSLDIKDSYNGLTSSFAVAVAMSGLIPALASYYQKSSESRETERWKILEAISAMIVKDGFRISTKTEDVINNADSLVHTAIRNAHNNDIIKLLKKEVIECSTALKQVIRTYNLTENGK